MKEDAKALLEAALKLSPEARAAIAGSLLQSLDSTVDEDAEAAWSVELAERVEEVKAGKAKMIPGPRSGSNLNRGGVIHDGGSAGTVSLLLV